MASIHDTVTLTPKQFEEQVKSMIATLGATLSVFEVQKLEVLDADDGSYEIDVTARFEALGGEYLTLIECKHHKNPIKREHVQILFAKIESTQAQKGMLFSTTDFQSGAVEFALKHRIALVKIADGRTAYITKATGTPPPLPPGFPEYAGWMTVMYEDGKSASVLVSEKNPELLTIWLEIKQNVVHHTAPS